jgi:CheY-like chemotaxis protein
LLDVNVPRRDGREVLERIRQSNLQSIPVIALSSSPRELVTGFAEADSYFCKPSDYGEALRLGEQLVECIRHIRLTRSS